MSFGREKRLLLGVLALLVPLPLPLNEVLRWPLLAIYVGCVALLLWRAWDDPPGWLPIWAMNLLGLAYLPVLYLDLLVFYQGQLIRPVVHLAMFTVVVKLFALRQERDKWHVMAGVFFLFLTAMATSVHPTIILYLVAVMALSLLALTKFSYFSVLARFGYREAELAPVPLGGFLLASTTLSLLVAIPFFAVLPRVQTPFVRARGVGSGTIIHASGFADIVTLDSIGSVRQNRAVVLRMRMEQPDRIPEVRLKAATYDRYDGTTWKRSRDGEVLPRQGITFSLADEPLVTTAEIWLLPMHSNVLPIPVETTAVTISSTTLVKDRGGAVFLPVPPSSIVKYETRLASGPVLSAAQPADLSGDDEPALDLTGVTPKMEELAATVMGAGEPLDRARRLETYLATQYRYSTEFLGRSRDSPLESFLFESKSGHCEYFASSMVLLLRSQGVPSRLVTGFLGAESNPIEGYLIVRQSNAHAWVEAEIPGAGWVQFDPTPPSGRPSSAEGTLGLLMSQIYDYMIFRWDRYVLTFGFNDQMRIFTRIKQTWQSFWGLFSSDGQEAEVPEASDDDVTEMEIGSEPAVAGARWQGWAGRGFVFVFLFAVAFGLYLFWRSRRIPTATDAFLLLKGRIQHVARGVGETTGPLAVKETVGREYPAAAGPTRTLVRLYLDESFGGRELAEEELERARQALREIGEVMRKAG